MNHLASQECPGLGVLDSPISAAKDKVMETGYSD